MEIRPCTSVEELAGALGGIFHYFGADNTAEFSERFSKLLDVERMHAAVDDGRIVGGAGALTYRMSVPGGGDVGAAGVTVVGVLPSHRRRGILTALMRAQLDDAHARGEEVAYLWASEGPIYGRFGYGLASRIGQMTLPRERVRFAEPFEPRGTVRLVSVEEALDLFPPLYEQMALERAGMFTRTRAWWEIRRLPNDPSGRQGPKTRALLELDGEPAGYALYTVKQEWSGGASSGTMTVLEAVAPKAEAARELWRWLLDFDWTSQIVADLLPLDHELFWLLAEPRRMRFELNDGVWVRLVDVGAALSRRRLRHDAEPVVFEVRDAFCPWNEGRWRVSAEGAERVDSEADIALDVTALGSVYLGGFTFEELARGLRLREISPGAVVRADELFRTRRQPWCAEIF